MHIARGIQWEQACILPLVPNTFWSVGCPREPLGPRVLPSLLARGKDRSSLVRGQGTTVSMVQGCPRTDINLLRLLHPDSIKK